MNEIKFTPGPWGIEQTADTNWIGPMRSDGKKIETIVIYSDREGLRRDALEAVDANAQLIAAAPELYAACLSAKKYLEPNLVEPGRTVFWKLVEALKKAGWTA